MMLPKLDTLSSQRRALDQGLISPQELCEAAITKAQSSTAFVSVQPLQSGHGPLAGIPLAHKDMFDRAGTVTGMGAHDNAGYTATSDATVLTRLDAAGQMDIGRLRMSEFAMGPSGHNAHHPMPRNPIVKGAIPGGSSSGSGVAVGSGIVAAALGSDTGGSIRIPAACNGVVGFKPTQGLVPVEGSMPLSWSQDCIGPLAASVVCATHILEIITDTRFDMTTAPLRVGLLSGAMQQGASDRMQAAMATVAELLELAGHSLKEIPLPFFNDLTEPANIIAISEGSAIHADRLKQHSDTYGPQVLARLTQAAAISAQAYLRAMQIRTTARAKMAEVFEEIDVILMPTLTDTPPKSTAVDVGNDPNLPQVIAGLTQFTRPASLLGLPSISLPIAMTSDGPLSLQIIGPPFAEGRIAALALEIETRLALRPSNSQKERYD